MTPGTSTIHRNAPLAEGTESTWRSGWRIAALLIVSFATGAAAAVALCAGALGQRVSLADLRIWIALLPVVALGWSWCRGGPRRRVWIVVWGALGLAALINLALGAVSIPRYGDWRAVERVVYRGEVFPRWFGGSALLGSLYQGVSRLPGLGPLLAGREGAGLFVRFLSILVTAVASAALLRRWPDRLRLVLPLTTPIWLLFVAGHLEYYPFVAWSLVLALAWVVERPLEERRPFQVGLLAALLFPFLYLGFAPAALALLAAYALAAPRKTLGALAWAAAAAVGAVLALWPGSLTGFFEQLFERGSRAGAVVFQPYRAELGGAESTFFSWRYALSAGHLWDLLLMLSLGAGPLLLLSLAAGAALRTRRQGGEARWRDPRLAFVVGLCLWQLFYFLRMVPRLGPVQDIDLFFQVYLTLAFAAGLLLDLAVDGRFVSRLVVSCIAVSVIAAAAVGAAALLVQGPSLPRPRWGGDEYLEALQRSRTAALEAELLERVDQGRLGFAPVGGETPARALGLSFDGWTLGSRPGAVLLENRRAEPLRPRLELACHPPPEALPVRAVVDDGRGARELLFEAAGKQSVALDPIAPGARLLVLFRVDRPWPGREAQPRQLGVRLVSARLEPLDPGDASP